MKKAMMFSMLILITSTMCQADMKWQSELTVTGKSEEMNRKETINVFHTGEMIRIENKDSIIIADFGKEKIYRLNPENKIYQIIDPQNPIYQSESSKKIDEILQTVMNSASLNSTEEHQKINEIPCQKFTLSIMGSQGDLWIATSLKEFKKLRAQAVRLAKKSSAASHFLPLAETGAMMGKIEDFVMSSKITTSMMEVSNRIESVEIIETLPVEMFVIPDDYVQLKVH